ncbi:MAG: hypothetical protein CMM70_09780 [Rhodospirillaceae bacterium]|nr:hypothetical protein [Rhodospirillaceae bacterium]
MSTLYVIDSLGQRDLILKGGAPHDENAPVLARAIDWPWMRPWSSPYGDGAKLWARVAEVSKPLGVAFLDTGNALPPRLSPGTSADQRIMVRLKDRSGLREGAWACVEVTTDAREEKGPRGRLIPPIPEVAQSKGKARMLRPATDPLAALLARAEAVVCRSTPDAVAAIRAAAADIPIGFFANDDIDATAPLWQVLDGPRVNLPDGLGLLIEPGMTGTMIDVNATRASADRMHTNVTACQEIGRIISALNVGGLIVIDFLGLETKGERAIVTGALREALADPVCESDAEPVNHLGIGLVTRARRGFSLVEQQRSLNSIETRVPAAFARQREQMIHG